MVCFRVVALFTTTDYKFRTLRRLFGGKLIETNNQSKFGTVLI